MNIETHVVPASISAALHAALFLAFSAGAAGPRITSEKPRQEDRPNLRWRFEPGRRHGRAVPFRMVVPVDFSVGGP